MASPDISENNKDAIRELADQIKAGDDALNKLKVQNLDFILDIPLKVSVELGRAKVIIKDRSEYSNVNYNIESLK